jgi:hypothetical protein
MVFLQNGTSWAKSGIIESSSSKRSSVYFGRFPLSDVGEAERHARSWPADGQLCCTKKQSTRNASPLQDLRVNSADFNARVLSSHDLHCR